jgi:hypothetical protein
MFQISLTPAAGKKLISLALAAQPEIQRKLKEGTIVVIAGTTNSYLARELLSQSGEKRPFNANRFFRGITLPPGFKVGQTGRILDESAFPGDVVIQKGTWQAGKTINDVAVDLKEGDIILKGANALDLPHRRAAIMIGNPNGGTIIPILQSLIGRRIRLILPVGLEKRVSGDLDDLANRLNAPGAGGFRLMPVPGEVFTEIEAIRQLSGASAELFAAGGIGGAEGSVWLAVSGTPQQEEAAHQLCQSVAAEPAFQL